MLLPNNLDHVIGNAAIVKPSDAHLGHTHAVIENSCFDEASLLILIKFRKTEPNISAGNVAPISSKNQHQIAKQAADK